MPKIRVLVVEDSLTVRQRLIEILESDPEIELVGAAEDGKAAIDLCLALRPDVITMDMMLPVMTGLSATEYIMAHAPTPILVVSSSVNRGELFRTYDALAAGAVDVLEKPDGSEPEGVWEAKFLSTLKMVSRIRVITHPRARLASLSPLHRVAPAPGTAPLPGGRPKVVAIGASTGGPGALLRLFSALPSGFGLPVLLVLHIGELFATALADWLDGQCGRRVAYAQDGDSVEAAAGRVMMAPPGRHMIVHDGRLRLISAPERHSCRPSVDVLFEAVAAEYGPTAIGCLLTGMGKDGAAGLLRLRNAGAATIAQDEATSVIYGMPREAVLLGAVQHVLPLDDIADAVAAIAAGHYARGAR